MCPHLSPGEVRLAAISRMVSAGASALLSLSRPESFLASLAPVQSEKSKIETQSAIRLKDASRYLKLFFKRAALLDTLEFYYIENGQLVGSFVHRRCTGVCAPLLAQSNYE